MGRSLIEMTTRGLGWSCGLLLGATAWAAGPVELDPGLPEYRPVAGVTGNLNSIGSDTLNNLLTLWSEAFREIYPNVVIGIEGKGSSTAPPALIESTAQLGPMSREMTAGETDAFERRFGYKPTLVGVGIDGLAVFVHKDNPIQGLTLRQVDAIFSSTYKRGGSPVQTWGDLGLTGDWANRPVSVYGRNSASGTYGFFKGVSLLGGDFKDSVKEQPGSSAVVQGVASDLYGIGYSGVGYMTAGVKTLNLGDRQSELFSPSYENALTGDYPLARFLIIYVNKRPNQPLDPLTYEFLRFVLSRQGQQVVIRNGYYPLPAAAAAEILEGLRR